MAAASWSALIIASVGSIVITLFLVLIYRKVKLMPTFEDIKTALDARDAELVAEVGTLVTNLAADLDKRDADIIAAIQAAATPNGVDAQAVIDLITGSRGPIDAAISGAEGTIADKIANLPLSAAVPAGG